MYDDRFAVVVVTGAYLDTSLDGVAMTAAFGSVIPWFPVVLSIAVFSLPSELRFRGVIMVSAVRLPFGTVSRPCSSFSFSSLWVNH